MYELRELAAAVAERLIAADYEEVVPDSRLFEDLQELAVTALEDRPRPLTAPTQL